MGLLEGKHNKNQKTNYCFGFSKIKISYHELNMKKMHLHKFKHGIRKKNAGQAQAMAIYLSWIDILCCELLISS